MADVKITALTAISSNPVNPATFPIPMVDLLDNAITASGTTKKVTVNQILGAGGTATLASATITGAATVGTTLGVTGASTLASVGVTGAATVGTTLGVTGQLSTANVLKTTGNPALGVAGATEAFVAHNTGYGAILYGQGTTYDAALLDRNTGLRLTVTTSGAQVSGDLTVSTGNVVMATSGKGIDFSAVTGGTGTATGNVLNDYEEGTFTPTVAGTTIAGVGVYADRVGRYTKVGNLVTLQVYLDWTGFTVSPTGNMFLGNFPFTTSSTGYSAAAIGYVNNIALTAGNILIAYAGSSTTGLNVYQTPTGGGAVSDVPIDTAGVIIFTITYRV